MKKILLASALLSLIFSCSNNDSVTPEKSILGKWYNERDTYIEIAYRNNVITRNDTTVINGNGTDYTELKDNDTMISFNSERNEYDTSTYSLSGNKLILYGNYNCEITEWTDKSLKYNYMFDDNYGGGVRNITKGYIELKR